MSIDTMPFSVLNQMLEFKDEDTQTALIGKHSSGIKNTTISLESGKSTMPFVEIYTDGACSKNPGPGGWGALLIFNDTKKEIFGYQLETTNNQMEISAAIYALQHLKKPCRVKVYTDSIYLQKGATEWIHNWQKNNWRKSDNKPVTNIDLWQNLQHEMKKHDIIWCWVKGHANNEGNNIADKLAVVGKETAKRMLKDASN